jgi:hypothetical protein
VRTALQKDGRCSTVMSNSDDQWLHFRPLFSFSTSISSVWSFKTQNSSRMPFTQGLKILRRKAICLGTQQIAGMNIPNSNVLSKDFRDT